MRNMNPNTPAGPGYRPAIEAEFDAEELEARSAVVVRRAVLPPVPVRRARISPGMMVGVASMLFTELLVAIAFTGSSDPAVRAQFIVGGLEKLTLALAAAMLAGVVYRAVTRSRGTGRTAQRFVVEFASGSFE